MKQEIFYNKTINKKELKSIVHSAFQSYGIVKATNLIQNRHTRDQDGGGGGVQ